MFGAQARLVGHRNNILQPNASALGSAAPNSTWRVTVEDLLWINGGVGKMEKKMETTICCLGFKAQGSGAGEFETMEKKMETTISCLGFRVGEAQGLSK